MPASAPRASTPARPGFVFIKRLLKGAAAVVLCGVLGVVILLSAFWVERRFDLTLPSPTGPFAVGRANYAWVDDAHLDPLAPLKGAKREVLAWIWYPASPGSPSAPKADYLPASWRAAAVPPPIFRLLTRDLSKVHAHSLRDPAVSTQEESYPVVILRAGASAEVTSYTTLAEDLASHGYVVVGFDAPYRTFAVVLPDGRVIRRTPENDVELCEGRADQEACAGRLLSGWTTDMAFVLDRLTQLNASDASGKFTGRLDMTRVGVFGHSFGGAAAALFCAQDARCKAGIDIDGSPHGSVIQTGIPRPFMIILSDHSHESDPQSKQIMADLQSIYDRLPAQARLFLLIRGANHYSFSDDGALLKSHIVMNALHALGIVGIDGRRQLAITTYCVGTFFDAYLKGRLVPPIRLASPSHPEIQVLE